LFKNHRLFRTTEVKGKIFSDDFVQCGGILTIEKCVEILDDFYIPVFKAVLGLELL